MRFDFPAFRLLPSRYRARCLLVAGLVMACDPAVPGWESCGDYSECAAYDYRVEARSVGSPPSYASTPLAVDTSGNARVDSLPVGFSLERLLPSAPTACRGARGVAYAMSCAGCESTFEPDSIFLTTDFYGPSGDTLKAGTALVKNAVPSGVTFRGSNWFQLDSGAFRDSAFEVRFQGRISGAAKSATLRVIVGNASLVRP